MGLSLQEGRVGAQRRPACGGWHPAEELALRRAVTGMSAGPDACHFGVMNARHADEGTAPRAAPPRVTLA